MVKAEYKFISNIDEFTLNLYDEVEISTQLFDGSVNDPSNFGYFPETSYYIQGYDRNLNSDYIVIHPEPCLISRAQLFNSKIKPISILKSYLQKKFESDKRALEYAIVHGDKACPFCKHGKYLQVDDHNQSVYCNSPSHFFEISCYENNVYFHLQLDLISIDGYIVNVNNDISNIEYDLTYKWIVRHKSIKNHQRVNDDFILDIFDEINILNTFS